MGLMFLKKITLFFLLIAASLLSSTSFAGRRSQFVNRLAKEVDDATLEVKLHHLLYQTNKDTSMEGLVDHKEEEEGGGGGSVHERVLKANTKDYGRYDPAPALVKPPFKLIPN